MAHHVQYNIMKTLLPILFVSLLINYKTQIKNPYNTNLDYINNNNPSLQYDPLQPKKYCTLSPYTINEYPTKTIYVLFPNKTTFYMKQYDTTTNYHSDYVYIDNYKNTSFYNAEPHEPKPGPLK